MISIWEKKSLLSYDIIIVGAGITGLSTAASLKERAPHLSVLILERGTLPTGASTKNAGFACFGSLSELSEDRKNLGVEGMQQLVEMRWKGLHKTRKRLGDTNIGFEQCGGYELVFQKDEPFLMEMEETNKLLADVIGKQVFTLQHQKIAPFGFENVQQMIYNPYEGALHSGKLMSSLWDYCTQLGVRIINGTTVDAYFKEGEQTTVRTKNVDFRCHSLALCTNAFIKDLVTEAMDLVPGRGMVTFIRTEQALPFQGTFHYDQGYFYFRHFEDGLIFGGGRNLDKSGEETTAFGMNDLIMDRLIKDLETMIIPGKKYQIEMSWSGIMAFGKTKQPIIQRTIDNIYLGVRLGGMGIAIGSMVGEELASLILGD